MGEKQLYFCNLKLDDLLLRQAEVHVVSVFQVESTFMQLRDGLISILQHHLLVHLPYHLSTQPVCKTTFEMFHNEHYT